MLTRQRLKEILLEYPDGVEEVLLHEEYEMVVAVISESFRGLDDSDCQGRVLEYLYKRLTSEEVDSIEFIFTRAPDEGEGTSLAA